MFCLLLLPLYFYLSNSLIALNSVHKRCFSEFPVNPYYIEAHNRNTLLIEWNSDFYHPTSTFELFYEDDLNMTKVLVHYQHHTTIYNDKFSWKVRPVLINQKSILLLSFEDILRFKTSPKFKAILTLETSSYHDSFEIINGKPNKLLFYYGITIRQKYIPIKIYCSKSENENGFYLWYSDSVFISDENYLTVDASPKVKKLLFKCFRNYSDQVIWQVFIVPDRLPKITLDSIKSFSNHISFKQSTVIVESIPSFFQSYVKCQIKGTTSTWIQPNKNSFFLNNLLPKTPIRCEISKYFSLGIQTEPLTVNFGTLKNLDVANLFPYKLSVKNATSRSCLLTWNKPILLQNSTIKVAYTVVLETSENSTFKRKIALSASTNAVILSLINLSPNTSYKAYVCCNFDSFQSKFYSVEFKTLIDDYSHITSIKGITVSKDSWNKVHISWQSDNQPEDEVNGYVIQANTLFYSQKLYVSSSLRNKYTFQLWGAEPFISFKIRASTKYGHSMCYENRYVQQWLIKLMAGFFVVVVFSIFLLGSYFIKRGFFKRNVEITARSRSLSESDKL